jgi:hypothetical protein
MSLTKNRFVLIWLCAAMLVVLIRSLAVTDLGYDLTVQLEAAQNLVAGRGLAIYNLSGEDDLAQPAKLITLTHFPAGYSLFAASLMWLGSGNAGVLKTGGALATILGWWGWGLLAYAFLREGLGRGPFWKWIGIVIAVSMPLLFTPAWQGTDIFLWAAVPWVVCWIVKGANETSGRRFWFDLAAGAACGLCFSFRYASAFLLAYAGCLILYQARTSLKTLLRRTSAFSAGAIPFLALQIIINHVIAKPEQTKAGLGFAHGFFACLNAVAHGFWMLPAANVTLVWWMPYRLMDLVTQPGAKLLSQPDAHSPWWLAGPLGLAALAFPLVVMRVAGWTNFRELRAAAIGLFWAIPFFLWACMLAGSTNPFVGAYPYVADMRYYAPVIPLAMFVFYALAAEVSGQKTGPRVGARMAGLAYVLGYSILAISSVLLLVTPLSIGASKREKLMGVSPRDRWPSTAIEYEFSRVRQRALELLQANPEAVLVTDQPQWFYAEPKVDRSRVHRLGDMQSTYVSGPAEIYVVALDLPGEATEDLHWKTVDGKLRRADDLAQLRNLRLLTRFPAERMKILEADIPASTRVTLKPPMANNASVAADPN